MPSLSELIKERKDKVSNLDPQAVGEMFANRGPQAIEQGLQAQIASGNPFAVKGADLIGNRAKQIYGQRLNQTQGDIMRNAIFADAAMDSRTSDLARINALNQERLWAEEQAKKAAERAKRKAVAGGVGGLIGTIGGAAYGGPAGAAVGGGLGTMLGGGY